MGSSRTFDVVMDSVFYALRDARKRRLLAVQGLQDFGSTSAVNMLRSANMQSALLAIGAFSMLESAVQQQLKAEDPTHLIRSRLTRSHHPKLTEQYKIYRLAINVLKHGKGRSYEELISYKTLPFRLKRPEDEFFDEGDVGEVRTLIETNPSFALASARIAHGVANALDLG